MIAVMAFLVIAVSTSFAQEGQNPPTSFPDITVVSPGQQTTVRPGDTVTVNIEVDKALNPGAVLVMANMQTGIAPLVLEQPPFRGTLTIPMELAGPIELHVMVKDAAHKIVGGLAVHLNVIPTEVPQKIFTINTSYRLEFPPASYLPARTAFVKGIYGNDVERDISDSSTGTRYRSSDTKVFTVDGKGVLEPVAAGAAFLIVEHRGLEAFAVVRGEGKEKQELLPIDKTAQVSITASAPRHKQGTVRYEMDVTIRNDAKLPLALPLHLVITGLADGVRVADASATSRVTPLGSPYVFVDVDEQSYLSPGNNAHATVTFINFDGKPLDHQLKLYTGTDP